MNKEQKLITVARFDDYLKADLSRQLLEDAGIKAFVLGQNVANVYSGVPAAMDVELQTPESEADESREILAAYEQERQQRGEDAPFEPEEDLDDEPEPGETPGEEQE